MASRRSKLMAPLALLAALGATACEDGSSSLFFEVEIVGADGRDPVASGEASSVRIDVREGDGGVQTLEEDLDEGSSFDLRLPITDLGASLGIRVTMDGPDGPLLGAPPAFAAVESEQFARIVVGAAGECAPLQLEDADLDASRAAAGVVRAGTFALVAGGDEPEGPSPRASFIDLLHARVVTTDDLPAPRGPTRAALASEESAVLVSERGAPLRYDFGVLEMRATPLSLHDGAGAASAVVARTGEGAAVVGGIDGGGAAVDGVSWVDADGNVERTRLAVPRAEPAAAPFAGGVLVAGGMAEGEPLAELVRPEEAMGRIVLEAPAHGVRDGAWLLVDAAGERALLGGGRGADGAVRGDTLRLVGCPSTCEGLGGPAWDAARGDPAVLPAPDGGGWLVGGAGPSGDVERVAFGDDGVRITPWATLVSPRAAAGVVRLEAGVLWVVGGRGADGPRRDIELCFPEALRDP